MSTTAQLTDMTVRPNWVEAKAFLLAHGAAECKHSGADLFSHLSGTADLLVRMEATADVVAAGLFHSVYGTESFRKSVCSEQERGEVAGLIGAQAEALAWMFCEMAGRINALQRYQAGAPVSFVDRQGRAMEVSGDAANALALIETANLLEQNELFAAPGLVRIAREKGVLGRYGIRTYRPRTFDEWALVMGGETPGRLVG